jgi:hypothetical protein
MKIKIFGRNGSKPRVKLYMGEVKLSTFNALRMIIQSLYDATGIEVLATPVGDGGAYICLENKKYILHARTQSDPRKIVLKFALRDLDDEEFLIWLLDEALEIEVENRQRGTSFKVAPPEYEPLS